MITAVRLRERNKKKNFNMRSYTAANGTVFKSGVMGIPSTWKIAKNTKDLNELNEIPQFERMDFEDIEELEEYVQEEMEASARLGKPAVRAKIEGFIPKSSPAPKRDLSVLQPPKEEDTEDTRDDTKPPTEADSTPADTIDTTNEGDSSDPEVTASLADNTEGEKESDEIIATRKILASGIERGLSSSYLKRFENRLEKLLAGN
jgi:hypothetical protein